jgi:hypothetical protein
VQPQVEPSAGGSITIGSVRIKLRPWRDDRCHGHGTVGTRCDSGKPTPSTGAVYRHTYSSPGGAIVPAITLMVTCLPSQALAMVLHVQDPWPGPACR